MKRRIVLLVTVALVTVAMMAATAMPALALSPYDCRDTLAAIYRGEELTPEQQQLVQTYPSFGACVAASVEARIE
jgi:hypothetical protein